MTGTGRGGRRGRRYRLHHGGDARCCPGGSVRTCGERGCVCPRRKRSLAAAFGGERPTGGCLQRVSTRVARARGGPAKGGSPRRRIPALVCAAVKGQLLGQGPGCAFGRVLRLRQHRRGGIHVGGQCPGVADWGRPDPRRGSRNPRCLPATVGGKPPTTRDALRHQRAHRRLRPRSRMRQSHPPLMTDESARWRTDSGSVAVR